MKAKFIEFLKDESGQTSTEYILLLAIVAILIIKVGGKIQTKLTGLVDDVFDNKLQTALDGMDTGGN